MATVEAPRVALYTRVSVDKRDTGRSVSEQEVDLRHTAEIEGWVVVRVFTDNDRSASRYARRPRPAFLELVQFAEDSKCDVVAVWELSRLSRDLGTLINFRDICRDREITWSIGGRNYDPSDERDTIPMIVQACQAEGESAQTSKRVRRAVTATAQAGRPHGRLTYGYRREYDPETKQFVAQVVDEDQAAILREIAERFLRGEAFYAIARDLTARGVPTPASGTKNAGTTWHPTNCARLLKNPAYAARRMLRGQYVGDAVWPAIFDETTWDELQRRLTDPQRRTQRETAVKHLLTGFAKCGACGSDRMGTTKQRGGYRAYICTKCFGVARRQDVTDIHVETKIVERLAAPDLADLFGQNGASADTAAEAHRRAAELRERLSGFEDEASAGNITPAAFGRLEAKLLGEIESAEIEARRASVPPVVRQLAGADPLRVAQVWAAMTVVERREVLRALGAVVTIRPTTPGRRVFDPTAVSVAFPRPGS